MSTVPAFSPVHWDCSPILFKFWNIYIYIYVSFVSSLILGIEAFYYNRHTNYAGQCDSDEDIQAYYILTPVYRHAMHSTEVNANRRNPFDDSDLPATVENCRDS